MNVQPEVLRRWALHQIRRATPTVLVLEPSRRERLQTRRRQLDHAVALAEYYRSRRGSQPSA
jgi:hypothetical protein